jgi:hypothetical protein
VVVRDDKGLGRRSIGHAGAVWRGGIAVKVVNRS